MGKKIFATFLFLTGLTFSNCGLYDDDCNCPPVIGAYFDIRGIESLVHHRKIPNTNSAPPMGDGETVPFDEYYGVLINYQLDYISQHKPEKPFFGSAGRLMACSCVNNGDAGAKTEKLKSVTVITLNDFNTQYSTGDTLNDLITVQGQPLEDYLQSTRNERIKYQNLTLGLSEAPETNPEYRVKVIVELDNGETYERESPTVIIQ